MNMLFDGLRSKERSYMLSLHKRKRIIFSSAAIVAILVPAMVFAVNKIIGVNNTSAVTYQIPSGYTTITDPNFYDCVAAEFVKEFPSESIPATGLTDEQLGKITKLSCSGQGKPDNEKITNATGLEKMVGLTNLDVRYNKISSIDVSNNTALTYLSVNTNQLTSFNVSSNTELTSLDVSTNQLTSLDVSNNTALIYLYANNNQLVFLGASNNAALKYFYADNNQLTSLDVSNNTALIKLNATRNQLTSLNMSNDTMLKELDVSNNQLTSLDITENTALAKIVVSNNQLTSLDISDNIVLTTLYVNNNQLTSLDITENTALTKIVVGNNQLTTLDVSNNMALEELYVQNNQLTSLDVSNNTALTYLSVSDNQLTSLNVSNSSALEWLSISNNQLTSLDVSNNTTLTTLYAYKNQLTSLDVSNNTMLTILYANYNQLTSLDVSNNTALETLCVYSNQFTFLDVSNDIVLEELQADDILVRTNIMPKTMTPNKTYDLNSVGFLRDYQSINATDNYSYNSDSKILTVTNYIGAGGYAQVSGSTNHTYKLQLPIFATFDANGGVGEYEMQSCYPNPGETTCSIEVTAPTRSNYFFLGWADSASATSATYAAGSPVTLNEPKTLYAIWAPIYKLSFNVNSGTGTIGDKTCHSTTTNGTCKITIPTSELTRNNYFFLGWADSATATSAAYQPGDKVTMSGNKTIYAIWAPIHTLTFDANGGSNAPSAMTCHADTTNGSCTVTVPSTTPTRNNYTFLGYADSASATSASSNYEAGKTVTLSNSKTIYAVWKTNGTDPDPGPGPDPGPDPTPTPATPEISFTNTTVTKTYGDASFTNTATTNSDGAITYSSNSTAVATVNSTTGKVTIKGVGTATITANVAATDNYKAGSATYTLTVAKATPSVTFTNTEVSKVYGDAKFTNTATTNSDGTITYSSSNTGVAVVNSTKGEVTIKGVGTATITANVAATNHYNAASATYTLTVSASAPQIAFTNTTVTKTYGDASFTNTATTNSDGVITYSSSNTAIAEVNSTTGKVTIKGAGKATITAKVAATSSYATASATYSLTINKKTSTIPSEIEEIKTGYVTDALSTISLTTTGLTWENSNTKIKEGYNGYTVNYTENNDPNNYTTEQYEIVVNGIQKSSGESDDESGNKNEDTNGDTNGGKNGIIAVPNTGDTTASFDNVTVVCCILFAILATGLGIGGYIYRNKKAHRKFEW